jgi:hypothetical protein
MSRAHMGWLPGDIRERELVGAWVADRMEK